MSDKETTIGVVGYGQQGQEYYELIKDLYPVTALIDPRFSGGDIDNPIFRSKMGLSEYDGRIFSSLSDAIAAECFDVSIVCVPHSAHKSVAEMLLSSRIPVIKEKPFALCSEDAEALLELSERNQTPLLTICQRDANPLFAEAKVRISEMGDPYSFIYKYFLRQERTTGWRAQRSVAEGGVLLDMGYHVIDVVQGLFGVPDNVSSMLTYANADMLEEQLEDFGTVLLSFNNRSLIGNVILGRHYSRKLEILEILCPRGVIEINPKSGLNVYDLSGNKIYETNIDLKSKNIVLAQIQEFLLNRGDRDYCARQIKKHARNVVMIEQIYRANSLSETFFAAAKGIISDRNIYQTNQPNLNSQGVSHDYN